MNIHTYLPDFQYVKGTPQIFLYELALLQSHAVHRMLPAHHAVELRLQLCVLVMQVRHLIRQR